MENPKRETFLLLGSNIGDRIVNLETARGLIDKEISRIAKSSSIYETAAWGNERQPPFLNQALQIKTALSPEKLLKAVKRIEEKMKRAPASKWAPRIIDIDILLMNGLVYKIESLEIPHPHLHKRRFTLVPLSEIAGNKMHPVFHLTIRELLAQCDDMLPVKIWQRAHTSAT